MKRLSWFVYPINLTVWQSMQDAPEEPALHHFRKPHRSLFCGMCETFEVFRWSMKGTKNF